MPDTSLPFQPFSRISGYAFLLFPLIFYSLLIFWLSSGPRSVPLPDFAFKDKFLHFMAFGFMGILAFRATRLLPMNSMVKRYLMAISYAIFYGVSDELHQYFVPGRHADVLDVVADALGAFFWTAVYMKIRHISTFRHPLL